MVKEQELKEPSTRQEIKDARRSAIGNISAAFELTLRQREFEITQLTQRNNFFMIFQGVVIAGLVQSQGHAAGSINAAVCFVGLVVSLLQALMGAGAKYWQIRWERATRTLEMYLLQSLKDEKTVFQFFTTDGKFLTKSEQEDLKIINRVCSARHDDLLHYKAGFIDSRVAEEMPSMRSFTDELILYKPSVGRIPIYVGLWLCVFWAFLLTKCVTLSSVFPFVGFSCF